MVERYQSTRGFSFLPVARVLPLRHAAGAFRDADRVRGLGEVHAFLVQQAHVLGASRLAHQLPRRIFDALNVQRCSPPRSSFRWLLVTCPSLR